MKMIENPSVPDIGRLDLLSNIIDSVSSTYHAKLYGIVVKDQKKSAQQMKWQPLNCA